MAPPPVTVPDLVLSAEAAATALAAAWRTLELRGRLTALDVRRGGRVLAHIEPAPGDEAALTLLPGTLANSGHAARWHRSILQLTSGVPGAACRDLLLAPLLDHPQQHNGRRFVALSWPTVSGIERRHLILTGTHAVDVLHSVLIGMLYSMPPDDLALSVVGDPAIAAIYRTTPHWVEAPESAAATLETLHRCLRRPHGRSAVRPLVCVLIDPDAATLAACLAIIPRIGSASLHLFLVCRTPRAALAQIDAIRLQLNEQRRLPHAELRIGSLRSTGHVRRLDHAAAVSLAAALPPVADLPLRPVVWQVPVPMLPTETSMPADLLAQLVAALVPATAPQLRWPVGPAGITPAILAALVDGLCQAPGIVAATPAGVTRRRLAALLAPEHRHAAALLFDWFDAAGVLVPPRSEELRLREPRMLCSHDRHWIADQLSCTPLPTREAQ
ncbi:MAG TPA: hypothetical protein PKA05_07945 [Roseiflexaceae bacterium]|nr:hypothetical protein [Roseiflexaceae bacterium]HMP40295.1 hypothetical protein [Roseiflexaceae bacterium]